MNELVREWIKKAEADSRTTERGDPRFEFADLPFEIRNSQFEIGEFPVRNACITYNGTRR